MLSFLPRILNLIFAPSPVLVVSPSSPLFNDDKLNLSLPLPSSPSTALDQLRFVQHKFQIETLSCTSILSDEKQVKESWIGLISRKKEEKKRRSTRGLKVEARRVESPSPLPKAPVEVVLSQRLQNEIDELIKASRWEEESDFDLEEEVERRRRERSQGVARASLPEQAAKKGLNWVEQGRAVEELRLASRFEVDDDDEEEELQPVVVEKEEEKVDVEVVEELDEEQLRLARIVIVEAAAAGKAWWRGVVEKKMHRAVSTSLTFSLSFHLSVASNVELTSTRLLSFPGHPRHPDWCSSPVHRN